jgi:penicillin-binding protein 2
LASAPTRERRKATPRRFLPPTPGVESPYRLTPQTALRIAILGAVVIGVFGILFFRLWALQVLSGPQYLQAAQDNQLRTRRVAAPRGAILDRNGNVLVANVTASAVEIWPSELPKQGRLDELRALSKIVHVPVARMVREIAARRGDVVDPVVVKQSVHEDQVEYLYEHQAAFQGVDVASTYIRHYPYQALGAQLLGYVGQVSAQQLKRLRPKGYLAGDEVGQSGVEYAYDTYLRGTPGLEELRVDSLGRPTSDPKLDRQAEPGDALRLTIDANLQRAAEQGLRNGIAIAHADGKWAADGGALVALDPRDGSVLALASSPTYKPSLYAGRVSTKKLAQAGLTGATAEKRNTPALDRATQGLYPAGSTFKPVTALAAMEERLVTPSELIPCTPSVTLFKQKFDNWNPFVNEGMTMTTALAQSCDTYFYELGRRFYNLPPDRRHPFQEWASRFGFGQKTGIDVGAEERGLVPTPEWRRRTFTRKTDPRGWLIDRAWKPGDSIQLAIGQKDLLVTPIQMARFYALIANGGKLVTPHVAADVEQPGARGGAATVLRRFTPPPPVATGVDQSALAVVRDGLYQAAHDPLGTSYGVFGNFPITVAGKTGTAEKTVHMPGYPYGLNLSQAWWCGYAPANAPEIVVCALIENGGHGGVSAAPAALSVFERYFGMTAQTAGPGVTD